MKRITLPYTREVSLYLQLFIVLHTVVYGGMYFSGIQTERALLFLKVFTLPSLFLLSNNLPFFDFKDDEKVSIKEAWIILPFKHHFAYFLTFCTLLNYVAATSALLKGDSSALWLAITVVVLLLEMFAFNSNNILFNDSHLSESEQLAIEQSFNDPGGFSYSESGFKYQNNDLAFECDWHEIIEIKALKTDNMTFDTVHMIITTEDGRELCINEDMPVWRVFIEAMSSTLPGIHPNWEFKVTEKPCELCETIVYERDKVLPE